MVSNQPWILLVLLDHDVPVKTFQHRKFRDHPQQNLKRTQTRVAGRSPARLGTRALATDSWACAVPNCSGAWEGEEVEMGPSPGVFLLCEIGYPKIPVSDHVPR